MSTLKRSYTIKDVQLLRGSIREEYTLAMHMARRLRTLLEGDEYVHAMGALTGCQAVQMVRAGLKSIYCSGWQVAADANTSGEMYPDQSLYPVDSVPKMVKSINASLRRADQIDWHNTDMNPERDWFHPIVADAEAGFGGPLNVFELTKSLIKEGAAAVHLEDQLSSAKKCGHLGGKVLVPGSEFIRKLNAARLACDVMGVPTVIIARTDSMSARLLTSDIDEEDKQFINQDTPRTCEGFYHISGGIEMAIDRACRYAPYVDMLWCETSTPDLEVAKKFASAVHEKFPGKWLAYNCSPSFNWRKNLSDEQVLNFQKELSKLGYRYQFITLAGFHSLNHGMYTLSKDYEARDMSAYADLQDLEFQTEGYTAVRHQAEVGAGYFDAVANAISKNSTSALDGSTESEQFS